MKPADTDWAGLARACLHSSGLGFLFRCFVREPYIPTLRSYPGEVVSCGKFFFSMLLSVRSPTIKLLLQQGEGNI